MLPGLDTDAVGLEAEPVETSWTPRDAMLYAVGVGAGQGDASAELAFTTENSAGVSLRVLPTFAVVLGGTGIPPIGRVSLDTLLHAEQSVVVHSELPVNGRARATMVVTGIYDKGEAAFVTFDTVVRDAATDLHYATLRSSVFVRGAGGWGVSGERARVGMRPSVSRTPSVSFRPATARL